MEPFDLAQALADTDQKLADKKAAAAEATLELEQKRRKVKATKHEADMLQSKRTLLEDLNCHQKRIENAQVQAEENELEFRGEKVAMEQALREEIAAKEEKYQEELIVKEKTHREEVAAKKEAHEEALAVKAKAVGDEAAALVEIRKEYHQKVAVKTYIQQSGSAAEEPLSTHSSRENTADPNGTVTPAPGVDLAAATLPGNIAGADPTPITSNPAPRQESRQALRSAAAAASSLDETSPSKTPRRRLGRPPKSQGKRSREQDSIDEDGWSSPKKSKPRMSERLSKPKAPASNFVRGGDAEYEDSEAGDTQSSSINNTALRNERATQADIGSLLSVVSEAEGRWGLQYEAEMRAAGYVFD